MKNNASVENLKAGGIYQILNIANGKSYIGSTNSFKTRFRAHMCGLRGNYHHSKRLQRAFNKYGSENFAFNIVEVCLMLEGESKRDFAKRLCEIEDSHISKFNSSGSNGYNSQSVVTISCLGIKINPDLVRKGIKHHFATLDEATVREIKLMLAKGCRRASVAQHFKIKSHIVGAIKTEGAWSCVEITQPEIDAYTPPIFRSRSGLDDGTIRQIKYFLLIGESLTRIAEFFSLRVSKISGIKRGDFYANITLSESDASLFARQFSRDALRKTKDEAKRRIRANLTRIPRTGENNSSAKLTESHVLEIIPLLQSNISLNQIGRQYGVTGTVISNIAKGKSWRHVTGFQPPVLKSENLQNL